jgi:hypothetical protein
MASSDEDAAVAPGGGRKKEPLMGSCWTEPRGLVRASRKRHFVNLTVNVEYFRSQTMISCFFRICAGSSPKGTFVPTLSQRLASHKMKELSKKFIASCQMTVCLVVSKKTIFMKHNGYR